MYLSYPQDRINTQAIYRFMIGLIHKWSIDPLTQVKCKRYCFTYAALTPRRIYTQLQKKHISYFLEQLWKNS